MNHTSDKSVLMKAAFGHRSQGAAKRLPPGLETFPLFTEGLVTESLVSVRPRSLEATSPFQPTANEDIIDPLLIFNENVRPVLKNNPLLRL